MVEFDACYFDVGNVLLGFGKSLEALAKLLRTDLDFVTNEWRHADSSLCTNTISPQEFWTYLKHKTNYKGPDINFARFWASHFYPIDCMHSVLRRFTKSGIPCGILTNSYEGVLLEAFDRHALPFNVGYIWVESWELGIAKPDPMIFDIAQTIMRMRCGTRTKILFIDDCPPNLWVARRRGMRTSRFYPDRPFECADRLLQKVR